MVPLAGSWRFLLCDRSITGRVAESGTVRAARSDRIGRVAAALAQELDVAIQVLRPFRQLQHGAPWQLGHVGLVGGRQWTCYADGARALCARYLCEPPC